MTLGEANAVRIHSLEGFWLIPRHVLFDCALLGCTSQILRLFVVNKLKVCGNFASLDDGEHLLVIEDYLIKSVHCFVRYDALLLLFSRSVTSDSLRPHGS